MIYNEGNTVQLPELDILTYLFDSEWCRCNEDTVLHAEAREPVKSTITKGKLRSLTKQIAHFLRNHYGIGQNGPDKDVVVTVSTGQSALAAVFLGVIAADGVYSAASPAATTADLTRQIKDGPSSLIVCSRELQNLALSAARDSGLSEKNVLILDSYPDLKLESADSSVRCDFKEELPWRKITNPRELENSKACVLYSSGTTGLPKGVCLSHTNLLSESALIISQTRPRLLQLEQQGQAYPRRTLAHLPTAHIAGVHGYFIQPFNEGTLTFWMPSFNFEDFVKFASTLKVSHFFTVPPIWMAMAKHPAVRDQFRSLRSGSSGAAPLSREMQEAASTKMGEGAVTQVWGLSETTGAATLTPADREDTAGSLGALLPNVRLRLVDDKDKDVEPGEPGEAWLKGPIITKGYHNNPKANEEGFTPDGWLRTGDVLRMEKDLLYLVDRKKARPPMNFLCVPLTNGLAQELIKYNGLQVAPAELEGLLTSHPGVSDAAVIGMQTERTEVPRAYVVRAPGHDKLSEQDLVDFVKSRASDHKRLRGGVVFVDAVPRSPAGKILRKDLRERLKHEMKSKL